ncbi:MAG: phage terminase large subunit [Candidatus Anstonellaceae archaeon]
MPTSKMEIATTLVQMEVKILPKYKPLWVKPKPGDRYYLITGGRGSGKSYQVAMFLLWLTYERGHTILFSRYTMRSAHISIIPEFVEKIEMLGKIDDFAVKKDHIENRRTGSVIYFRGIKTSEGTATANLKSINNLTTVVIDEADEVPSLDVFERIDLSVRSMYLPNRIILVLNPSRKSHWIYKEFIEKEREDTIYIHTTFLDNLSNLSKSFLLRAKSMKESNPLRFRNQFLGEWLSNVDGLLWTAQMLENIKVMHAPELTRVVIAIDPAITANANSDETGIVVAGQYGKGYYVIADHSGRYTPAQWASLVAELYKKHNADCIVVEVNQGGDMVENIMRPYLPTARIKKVHAYKGKYLRAEPIFALYEQRLVWHVGSLAQLEAQMITFNPGEQKKSPDRVDALVYALGELSQPLQVERIFAGKVI